MKWKMIDYTTFTAEENGYNIAVYKGDLGWAWDIVKDGNVVDSAYYHKPTNSELSAKVQVERQFNKLLTTPTTGG